MAVLRMKGVKIKNLEQLREHFYFTSAKDYLLQGTLAAWMREQGENELAEELDDLKNTNYSDQTLMDNFCGIFELQQTFPVPENTTAIVVSGDTDTTQAQTNTIAVGNASFAPASCYGETSIVYLDEEKLSRYGLQQSGGNIDDVRKLAKNRLALYLMYQVAKSVMHEDFLKVNKCQWTLELDTRLCDVGWTYKHFNYLDCLLYKLFSIPLNSEAFDTHIKFSPRSQSPIVIVSVQQLLDFIGRDNVKFREDPDYDQKFTYLCANGRFDELLEEYNIA